ncbi:MAG: hypothetical protein ACT4N4_16355 [Rhodospirillales bacterium]
MRARSPTALVAAALLAAGALGGCGGTGGRALGEAPAPRTSLVTADLSSAAIHGQPAATAPVRREPQAAAVAAPPTPPAGVETPRKLVGFDRAALQAVLGAPSLQRAEGKAELWQYRAQACVLDVFLYPGKDGQPRVTHADLRGRRDNRPAPQGCYAEIVAGGDKRAQTAETKGARN